MQKPSGYDQAPAYTGESFALPAGGYVCKILKAEESTSQSGRPMLVLLLDIAEGEHKDYYRQQFDRIKQSNPDAKWGCVFRQLVDGNSTPFFKGMITSIEVSNSGYKWNWDEKTLAGKLVGALFGREQYLGNDGNLKWTTKCRSLRSVETIRSGKFDVPEDKFASGVMQPAASGGFTPVEDDGDLPF